MLIASYYSAQTSVDCKNRLQLRYQEDTVPFEMPILVKSSNHSVTFYNMNTQYYFYNEI